MRASFYRVDDAPDNAEKPYRAHTEMEKLHRTKMTDNSVRPLQEHFKLQMCLDCKYGASSYIVYML